MTEVLCPVEYVEFRHNRRFENQLCTRGSVKYFKAQRAQNVKRNRNTG